MASSAAEHDSDDGMDELMDKFKSHSYSNAFKQDNWEEEFDKIPMFMKKAPEEIDPHQYPELACLQAMIHDEDRSPEEQAKSLKNEGNAFFQEKNYKKAIVAYTAGLKKKCDDQDLSTVLLTNRAAAHFHLGNMRSALNDAAAAKKIRPDHLKALIRGAQCCIELRNFSEAVQWCDEGLKVYPADKKLQDLRASADKHKRAAERDARKAKVKEKKLHGEKEALLAAIKGRGIKLLQSVDDLSSKEVTGAQVSLDDQGSLHWPVLFLYPEHQQSDFVSAFCESSCFIDHLSVMFGEELPPWDVDRKYHPQNLQLYFEHEQKETLYQVKPETQLLEALQHKRFFVKAGTPSFIVLVKGSSFTKQFLTGKKIQGL
ncbi:putative tetratricopeptide repeat protein 4 [Scophthalmus maximus]|uniref:Putative tetratricopeptide repeat protein 4 n=1 Tax=Scophthalmus maximus TaxID=52904 RepID=A0A2U9C3N2_SCOMX|nr:putative tetratricopeptide repeat protein 4 [Scophthalmus maximus]